MWLRTYCLDGLIRVSSTPLTWMYFNDDGKMLSTTMRSTKEHGEIWLG